MRKNGFKYAGDLNNLQDAGALTVQVEDQTLALFLYGDQVYAVDNRCPHMGFPLHQGSVHDGILTCHWHHARFDLASGGTFDQWADDVPSFPVEIENGEIWVDLSPRPDPIQRFQNRLQDGLERNLSLVIAKSIIGLLEHGADPLVPFKIGLEFGTTFRRSGWGQGLTILTCLMNLYPSLEPVDQRRALYHGLSAVANDSSGHPARFLVDPLPGDPPDIPTLKRWFRQFIEVRDSEGAERCILTALQAGADHRQMADLMFTAATDHRYIQLGHPLDFTNKAFEALDKIGWDQAGLILTSLVNGYAEAPRMEENNAWRHPIDLIKLLDETFEKIPNAILQGRGQQYDPRDHGLAETVLGDDPYATAEALLQGLSLGASPTALAEEVVFAAAQRIAQFHTSNEFGDWDTALHTFTFANAVHQGLLRVSPPESEPYPLLLRGVFDAAMSVYLDRFLNVPAARPPEGAPTPFDEGTFREAFERLLDKQQQVNPAAELAANFLAGDGDTALLEAVLGGLLLREDRDFHTIQTLEAAFRQVNGGDKSAREKIYFIAAARYLAAHSPTMRAQNQTFTIALRLARGENLFE